MEEMVMRRTERMSSTREEMIEVKLRLGKDEKRAREGGIMLDVKVREAYKKTVKFENRKKILVLILCTGQLHGAVHGIYQRY